MVCSVPPPSVPAVLAPEDDPRSPPRQQGPAPRLPAGSRHARAQPFRVVVLRVVEDARRRPLLDHDAAVQHDRVVGELAHHREVVADQHVGHAGRVADVGEQVQHLRLDRHVERGDRLVEDQHPRLGGQRARDRDPLALPAGQRPRQRAGLPLVEADQLGQLLDPGPRCGLRPAVVQLAAPRRSSPRRSAGDQGWCTGPGRRSAPRCRGGAVPWPSGPASTGPGRRR